MASTSTALLAAATGWVWLRAAPARPVTAPTRPATTPLTSVIDTTQARLERLQAAVRDDVAALNQLTAGSPTSEPTATTIPTVTPSASAPTVHATSGASAP